MLLVTPNADLSAAFFTPHVFLAMRLLALQITDEETNSAWRSAFCGTLGRFIAGTDDAVRAFELPSGKQLADFPIKAWQDENAMKTDPSVTVACSFDGNRVAIRSGVRLTLHDLK